MIDDRDVIADPGAVTAAWLQRQLDGRAPEAGVPPRVESIVVEPLYLIDRQPFAWSVRVGLAATDLVHAAVPYWTPDERRALEPVLLDAYHAALCRAGVTTYGRARLDEDYRLCLVHAVHVAIEWGTDAADLHAMRWLWEAQLERAERALGDHPIAFATSHRG